MKKQSPPILPPRFTRIPDVLPSDPAYLFYIMLRSCRTSVTNDIKAATAAMAFGYLLSKPDLLANKQVRMAALGFLFDLETELKDVEAPFTGHVLHDLGPKVRTKIEAASAVAIATM